ncbi:MAG TPA: hypothetical protein PK390_03870 [Fervidobacterium nodosum]|nr:hypothetical protein [Fervidobacterium nodosum]
MSEKTLDNNRILKNFKAFSTVKNSKNSEPQFLNYWVSIFGDKDHPSWHGLLNNWIVGEFKLTSIGDKLLFMQTDVSKIGVVVNAQKVSNTESHQNEGVFDENELVMLNETIDVLFRKEE